jgi:hypothetical protein
MYEEEKKQLHTKIMPHNNGITYILNKIIVK